MYLYRDAIRLDMFEIFSILLDDFRVPTLDIQIYGTFISIAAQNAHLSSERLVTKEMPLTKTWQPCIQVKWILLCFASLLELSNIPRLYFNCGP